MSKCLTPERLRAFVSDSLSPDEMAEVSSHLETCDACQDAASREADDSAFRREFLDAFSRIHSRLPAAAEGRTFHDATTLPANDETVDQTTTGQPDILTLGRYTLRQRIARGGAGEVWEAYDPKLKRPVAIKMVRRDRRTPEQFVGGFLEEGQKLASLRHDGIVDVYDFGEHANKVYIVTELLSGGTLATQFGSSRPTFREAASLVIKVARAAHAAHLAGLVHRDIKPANIVLDAGGIPRLSDFGLAISQLNQQHESPALEGTVPYMSPEQSTGRSQLVASSDIYSLGVVFYELLTGTVPHRGASIDETLRKIQTESPLPPRALNPAVPLELEQICLKCLQKVPEDRFASAAELADALEAWLVRSNKRTRIGWLAASVLVGFVGLGLWIAPPRRDIKDPKASANPPTPPLLSPSAVASEVQHRVRVLTEPAGARVVVYPFDKRYGLPDGTRRVEGSALTPIDLNLTPGFYLVVVTLDDGRFHEVYRSIPELPGGLASGYRHRNVVRNGDWLEWPEIKILGRRSQDELAPFTGDLQFQMGEEGSTDIPRHSRRIPPFLLETREVTFRDIRSTLGGHMPPSLAHLEGSVPSDDLPVTGIWWDDAVNYAEKVGMRLPSEAEYEFAATNGGTRKFPWGDSADNLLEWPLYQVLPPLFDRLEAGVPVLGLYSSVPEWTSSPAADYPRPRDENTPVPPIVPGYYIVRGGPPSVIRGDPLVEEFSLGPRFRVAQHERQTVHTVGMRCARSPRPRLTADDLELVLEAPPDSGEAK
ncbi:MAG: protein kinase [Planctomycetota bacterium]